MNFYRAFSLINEKEANKFAIWSLIMSFESLMDITKIVPSLESLITFIGISNLFGVKKLYLMDL